MSPQTPTQSGQKGKGGIPKSLVVNLIIIMATVVLGIKANLLTSAIHVEDPTPIPGAPRSEETMVKRGPEPPPPPSPGIDLADKGRTKHI